METLICSEPTIFLKSILS